MLIANTIGIILIWINIAQSPTSNPYQEIKEKHI